MLIFDNPSSEIFGLTATPSLGDSATSKTYVDNLVAGGSSKLSGITAANAANTINNGDFDQVWNWSMTTNGTNAFTFGENVPSVGIGTTLFTVATATGSTAAPFSVTNQTQQIITTSAAGALSLSAQFGENVTINTLNAPGAFGGSIQIFGGNAPAGGSIGLQAGSASNPAFGAGSSLLDGGTSPAGFGATVHSNGGSASGGGSLLMTGGNAAAASGLPGGSIIATAGVGDGAGPGGALFLEGGNGSATSGGGTASIQGGSGGSFGGLAAVIGGVASGTGATGGQVSILGGAATDGDGGGVNIQANSGTGTDRNGGSTTILAGNATGTGASGILSITSGSAGANGAGGQLNIFGGVGGTIAGSGGTINIQGGLATINSGGPVNITGGTGVPGGSINITGGLSTNVGNSGGSVAIFGGTPTDGNGGSLSMTGADAVGTNRDGGSTFIGSGSGTGTGVAGNIVLAPGIGGYVSQHTTGVSLNAFTEKSIIARATTTNATITEAFTDGVSKQMVLPDNSTWNFEVRVVARRTDATDESFAAVYEGAIDRQAGAATTAIVGSVLSTPLADDSAGAWTVLVDADAGSGALRVQVTGQAAKTIRWNAFVKIVEVTN